MKKHILLLLLAALLTVTAFAAPTTTLSAVGSCRLERGKYLPLEGEEAVTFSEGLCAVKMDGYWGYIDASGLIVIEPTFDAAGAFTGGMAPVSRDGRLFFIDASGRETLDMSAWEDARRLSDGLIHVQKDGLWGVTDDAGQVLIAPAYDTLGARNSELFCASKNGKYGFVNSRGEAVIPLTYDYAEDFSDDRAYVEADGKGFLIDYAGNVVAENVYSGLHEGLALTMADGLWGFVDASGQIAIPCTFHDAEVPQDGMVRICMEGLWGFADLSGAVVIEPAYDYVWPFSDGCAIYAEFDDFGINVEGYGYIDRLGKVITRAAYDQARPFSDGFAAVDDGEHWGFVDASGRTALAHSYNYAGDFENGYAVVATGADYQLIDHEGKPLTIHREGELPKEPEPVEEPQEEKPESEVNVGAIIVLVITAALILFIAGTSLMRGVNIRRRRNARRSSTKQIKFLIEEDENHERD